MWWASFSQFKDIIEQKKKLTLFEVREDSPEENADFICTIGIIGSPTAFKLELHHRLSWVVSLPA